MPKPEFYQGQPVEHARFGKGNVVSPRIKGGWTTVRFEQGGPVIKCSGALLSAA